ncbi:OLC1v1024715C1 [Oldenlandia corymbosa var. corymbosa]|uniref:OLC1v1024715C1 n=1 Tax=Oldenlandia corymbosa var. corymbosa TaxID=529605 RepID=A0AAV1C6G3_OLDCO|nr:OLC1v1024715C1 [Oldenlandia corymbosa var. corymbosa]
MFSPGTRKANYGRKDQNANDTSNVASRRSKLTVAADNDALASPKTPFQESRVVPNRPSTGTPAPWAASRLSVVARIPPVKRTEKAEDVDLIKPVFVGEFPQVLRDEQQAALMAKQSPGELFISGGLDKETLLAWVLSRNKLFIWSYLFPTASRKCIVLDLPSNIFGSGDSSRSSLGSTDWLICFLDWDSLNRNSHNIITQCNSAGIILCNRKARILLYWPDIYSDAGSPPIVSYALPEESSSLSSSFTSLIATPIPGAPHVCISLACSSNGELWQFSCSPSSIERKKVYKDTTYLGTDACHSVRSKGYPRSLTWHSLRPSDESKRQFLLLTDREIQSFSVQFTPGYNVSKHWSHEIIGSDGDLGIQKDLAGQKRIWPLDLQIDNDGKVITILIAIFCKDRITSSSYTEYSLLIMQYKSGVDVTAEYVNPTCERVLEKKAPIQVIIPKARVEDEEVLFSMRLKIGGKPAGSVIILSGDGTATVSHYWRTATRLYQFDLPYDAGKVLDASVFPSSDDGEDGAWAVLTEKAGIWAIPERAILLGGVEPPERSLSRKGSSNERVSQEERKNLSFAGNFPPRRASSEAGDAGDRHRAPLAGIGRRSAQDEESEALLNQLFNDFLLSGQVEGSLDKLKHSGAFEREGETNVFARTSKSIVDTLAKHWTTTRGVEIVALSIVSAQLMEKQQKHEKFLQFLALSKCHDDLCTRQRLSLQIILEHGEKLSGMIQLKELQNTICQSHGNGVGSYTRSESQLSGALWDLIQFVGERARRKTVLLMDRENAEVFYSKVSDIEELFYCLEKHLDCIIGEDMPVTLQFRRVCELSNACVSIFYSSVEYRSEHHLWYPPPDGLTPWYCHSVVRSGMWSIASYMLRLSNEASHLEDATKSDFYSHMEALTEVLLETYTGAITAKSERNEVQRSLLDEYWRRRDELLDSLHKQVTGFFQDSSGGTEGQNGDILRKLASRLLSIAKRHEGYQTLWNICCDLNDADLLRNFMQESVGPKGGFSNFVFKQLYDSKQYSKVLRYGEDFPDELAIFLKPHQDLRWLHELFLNQFSAASETLHLLALSQDNSQANEEADVNHIECGTSLAERKRFLNLSKIAAMAGRDTDYLTKVKRIEADLNMLKVQEEISVLCSDIDEMQKVGNDIRPPVDLINLCLKSQNRVLALRAFDVFAWTSSSFIKRNTSLLEECWKNAAKQDDWERIHQLSVSEGWTEEETLHALEETVLFQASCRCYGPESKSFDGGFDIFPPRVESQELPYSGDLCSTVESILMQHKDFPVAGKLMLTAVMLGVGIVEEAPSPME